MATPAGWYKDPSGGSGLRYWDGAGWTRGTKPSTASAIKDSPLDLFDVVSLSSGKEVPTPPKPSATIRQSERLASVDKQDFDPSETVSPRFSFLAAGTILFFSVLLLVGGLFVVKGGELTLPPPFVSRPDDRTDTSEVECLLGETLVPCSQKHDTLQFVVAAQGPVEGFCDVWLVENSDASFETDTFGERKVVYPEARITGKGSSFFNGVYTCHFYFDEAITPPS